MSSLSSESAADVMAALTPRPVSSPEVLYKNPGGLLFLLFIVCNVLLWGAFAGVAVFLWRRGVAHRAKMDSLRKDRLLREQSASDRTIFDFHHTPEDDALAPPPPRKPKPAAKRLADVPDYVGASNPLGVGPGVGPGDVSAAPASDDEGSEAPLALDE